MISHILLGLPVAAFFGIGLILMILLRLNPTLRAKVEADRKPKPLASNTEIAVTLWTTVAAIALMVAR